MGLVMDNDWRIDRESSESDYSWDSEMIGNMGIFYDRNSVK